MSRNHNFRGRGDSIRIFQDGLRRVSFQHNQGRIGRKPKWNARHQGQEDDVVMANNNQRRQQGSNRGNRGRFRSEGDMRKVQLHLGRAGPGKARHGNWFQIKITLGARYTQTEILGKLQEHLSGQVFHPICYQIMGADSQFYVERFQTAQMLLGCTRKITLSDGTLIIVKIREMRPPHSAVDNVMMDKMKTAMARRYVVANKALDLSYFYRDPEFIDGLYVPLNRGTVQAAAFKIIAENIPDLIAINLDGNDLTEFVEVANNIKKFKYLQILHLSDNNILHLNQLNPFKGLDITEMMLEKNPVAKSFTDRSHFVSEVRKRFPKLMKLDNSEMAPIVTFDTGDDAKLPTAQAAFVCHADGRGFVKAFLSQYFELYDSDDRTQLAQAYAENACFSMTAFYPLGPANGPRLNAYISDGRNLLRVQDFHRRKNKLFTGKTKIVEMLSKLPATQHDLLSFAVDLPFFSPDLISLSVCGVFREKGSGLPSNWPHRYFARTYLIVPMGAGFCIVNETVYISNATDEQIAVAFKSVPDVAPVAPSPPAAPALSSVALDDTMKLQLVQTVAQQTGMNLEWSKKCLEETEWNLPRAAWTFEELQKRGGIPAEAFIK